MGTADRLRRTAIRQGEVEQRFPHIDLSNPLFRAAMEYAANGLCVFPLKERDKIPVIPKSLGGKGYLDATTNLDHIRRWWAQYPKANIGIGTRASGLVVLDVDPRHGGAETLAALEDKEGPLPPTVESITGSGGRHAFFLAPEPDNVPRKSNVLGEGVDIPNYVVAPPSIHPDTGREYTWDAGCHPEDIPFASLPEWIVAWSTAKIAREAPDNQAARSAQQVPNRVSRRTEEFIAGGAPIGQQRWRALAATRNLLSRGIPPGEVTDLIWAGLRASAQEDRRRAWSFKDAQQIVSDLAGHPRSKTLPEAVPISRIPSIRDIGTALEQPVSTEVEQAPVLATSVARRASVLAGGYQASVKAAYPIPPNVYVKGGSGAYRRKDDHRHIVIHSGASETWQEEGNAILRRCTFAGFYLALLFDVVEREDNGAIYHFRRHLAPETVKEDQRYLTNLHSRLKRHQGEYVTFTIQEEDGWWLHTFSNLADITGDTEPTVADQGDFLGWLAGLGKAPDEYHRPHPVTASEPWQMPRSRTGEWEALGNQFIPDLLHFKEIEDDEYASAAAKRGIATWVATEVEVMGRSPEAILHTRHFQGGELHTAKTMLAFLKNDLGFFLYPKAMAELEAPEPNTAPWDHATKAETAPPPPPKQAQLAM